MKIEIELCEACGSDGRLLSVEPNVSIYFDPRTVQGLNIDRLLVMKLNIEEDIRTGFEEALEGQSDGGSGSTGAINEDRTWEPLNVG